MQYLIETSARDDEWNALQSLSALPVVNFIHGQRQNTRLVVQALYEDRVIRLGRQDAYIQVQMRLLRGNSPIVLRHLRLAVRYVDARIDAPSSVLWVGTDDLKAVAVDAASKCVPERVLDHAREAIDRVLRQPRLVEDDPLAAVIACEGELLEQVGEHVCAL